MDSNNNNNIRVVVRDQNSIQNNIQNNIQNSVIRSNLLCQCERCRAENNIFRVQILYNDSMRNIRMNDFLNSLNGLFSLENEFDLYQDDIINSMFETYQNQELDRNEKIKIDVESKKFSETEKNFTSCSICSDDYKDEDIVSTLDCSHIFHKNCIEEWGHYNPVCPVCKSTIKTQ